ncbi:TadE/TadG family type IV pilus assembly protein [Pseudomonas sp. 21TX0197]|uniref:TadE/TadG family type IV pilus assembly protein n=1 Tax=unclassified Pseudomonas TaxID=196821 RepID=UPI0009152985|nr:MULTISPECIES: TadE/TadG family type IV pilus assembly protein [unclassified Pseudomonas]MDB6445446.1 TadE/TadG family type IV pilus assembly protein [Pseudomonas sp. 21TX0197]SFY13908.1 Flp pilus assembly protein TadG [Pseudomonas sp. NFACC36]
MRLAPFDPPQAQRGVALVEFTLVLPLLLLLLLAFGEFGRMLLHYNVLLQASREADRFVASQAWNSTLGGVALTSTLQTQTKNVAVYGVPNAVGSPVVSGLTTAHVEVAVVGSDHVRVTITYPFCPVIGAGNCSGSIPAFFGNAMPLGIPLVATTVMRVL